MIDIFQATKPTRANDGKALGLGIDPKRAAVTLRDLAGRMERGEIGVSKIQAYQMASGVNGGDWFAGAIIIEYDDYRPIDQVRLTPEEKAALGVVDQVREQARQPIISLGEKPV